MEREKGAATSAPAPPDETVDPLHAVAYRGALTGADAYHGVMLAVRTEGSLLRVGNRFVPIDRYAEIAFLAFGSASVSQALALNDVLGERLTQGFLAGPMAPPKQVPFRSVVLPSDWPGAGEADAARSSSEELARELPDRSLLIVLLSPGALGVLSAPPPDFDGLRWRAWLQELHRSGATGAEVSRVARVLGDGPVGGSLARTARRAEVVTLVVERGDGGSVGGGPTRPVREAERRDVARVLERCGARNSLPPALARRLEPDPTRASSLPETVSRPVVVAGPADALAGAADAVGERKWMPRLAGLFLPGPPEQVARTFAERVRTMVEQYRPAVREARRQGLVAFAMTTFGLPEGVDERPTIRPWLESVAPQLPEPGSTVAALRTGGGDGGLPPGLVAARGGGVLGLPMAPGVTDTGVLLLARVPIAASAT